MEPDLAAPAAQGYFRKFWLEVKARIGWRDYFLAIGGAVVPPVVAYYMSGGDWKIAVTSSLIGVSIVFALDFIGYRCIYQGLWVSFLEFQRAQSVVRNLEKKLSAIQQKHVNRLLDDGIFWKHEFTHSHSELWTRGESRWVQYVGYILKEYYGQSVETTFNDTIGTLDDEVSDLNRRLENLSSIVRSFSPSPEIQASNADRFPGCDGAARP